MKFFVSALILVLGLTFICDSGFAGDKVHSEVWQKIDDAGRANLQKCLSDKSKSIKHCVKETKDMMKREMKKAENMTK